MKTNFLTLIFLSSILLFGSAKVYATDTTPPTTPTWQSPASYVLSDTQVAVLWNLSTDNVGVAGYYIYRCTGSSCTMPSVPTLIVSSPTSNYYTDGTVNAGTTYSYTIAAYDAAGNISAQSAVATVTTTGSVSTIVPVITMTSPVNSVGTVGATFSFNMRATTDNGVIMYTNPNYSWDWDFGDGNFHTGDSAWTHVYAKSGSYTLRVTIFNNSTGDTVIKEQTLTVLPASIANCALRLSFNNDIFNYSGNQLTALGVGGVPAYSVGVTGLAMALDGTANGPYLSVSDGGNGTLDGLSAASLALFVRKNDPAASGTVLIKQGVYSIAIASQGVTATLTNGSSVTVTLSSSTVANNDTNWHHYAVTYDGTNANLYFDGAVVATQPFSGIINHAPGANLLLGKTISGNTINGSIDTARLYNLALSAAQVQYLYHGSKFGDVNNDGSSTAYDALLTAQSVVHLITLTTAQKTQADVSGNPTITVYDALLIAQHSVKLNLKFPVDISEE